MRRKMARGLFFLRAFCLCCLCTVPLAAQNVSDITGDTFEEVPGRGLVIRSKPAGVTVFIDGVERGKTPFSIDTLRSGMYNVLLQKEGWKERRFKVTLSENSRLVIACELEEALGQVVLTVSRAEGSPPELPLRPIVYAGESGEPALRNSPLLLSLPPGLRTVRVRAFGWEDAAARVLVQEGGVAELNIVMQPAAFTLRNGSVSRKRFNPHNSGGLGAAEFYFEVSAPGAGNLTVRNSSGDAVYRAGLGPFNSWPQAALWNGRDSGGALLPEGVYTVQIEAAPFARNSADPRDSGEIQRDSAHNEAATLSMEVEIDYGIAIYPLSLSGGVSGLAFAPVPAVLPRGSFQVEAGLLFGSFSAPESPPQTKPERPFTRLPFEAGLRFSPLTRFEAAAAVNATPRFDGKAGWGFTTSAKYQFFDGTGGVPLGLAAALSWAIAGSGGEAPLGSGRGGGLYLPLSLELDALSLVFSPGMRWAGADDPVPRLLLSAGGLWRGSWYTAGLSFRGEFDFTNSGSRAGVPFADRARLLTGIEAKFYPPPSNLVFSVLGGGWFRGKYAGAFGGLGVGVLF
jgi:hypothetical protein